MIETYTSTRQLVMIESRSELAEYLARPSIVAHKSIDTDSDFERFAGTASFPDAERLLDHGWTQGAKELAPVIDAVLPHVTQLTTQESFTFDPVEGIGIDIGRYTSGQPDCWIAVEPYTVAVRGSRVLRVGFSTTYNSLTAHATVINYGACIVAAVAALEQQGYQVELWALNWIHEMTRESMIGYLIKPAQDTLQLSKLAFAACHPSMLRRIIFAVLERTQHMPAYKHGYGRPVKDTMLPEWIRPQFDVYIPSVEVVKELGRFSREQAEALAIETLVRFQ